MKKSLRIFGYVILVHSGIMISQSTAQSYCVCPPFISGPFSGITNVTLENLNNTSSDGDGVTYYDAVTVPDLTVGQTYTMSVTTEHQLIGSGFSGNLNTVAWIDWNGDKDFEDAGEEVFSAMDEFKGTYTRTFTVPADAVAGITRMRVYDDMPAYEGHEIPHPCGYSQYPSNPIGHHGEVEDYNVNVVEISTGIDNITLKNNVSVYNDVNGMITFDYKNQKNPVSVQILEVSGKIVYQSMITDEAGKFQVSVNESGTPGMYIIQLISNSSTQAYKLVH